MITDVFVKDAGKKGKGVFALKDFKKGEFIFCGRRGKIIKNKEMHLLSKDDRQHLNEIDEETSEIMRSPGRYINHSCDPNAISKGSYLYAWKDIKKGEEITVDYRINAHWGNKWKCYCGSKNCKGYVISDFFTISEKLQKVYLPYAPKFIREEYRKRQGKNPPGR